MRQISAGRDLRRGRGATAHLVRPHAARDRQTRTGARAGHTAAAADDVEVWSASRTTPARTLAGSPPACTESRRVELGARRLARGE
jgi:hypothetical protein